MRFVYQAKDPNGTLRTGEVEGDSFEVASRIHDLTVKIRPDDTEKIALIRDLISTHVDVNRILKAI